MLSFLSSHKSDDVVTLNAKGKTTKGFSSIMNVNVMPTLYVTFKVTKYYPSISLVINISNFQFSWVRQKNKFCRMTDIMVSLSNTLTDTGIHCRHAHSSQI